MPLVSSSGSLLSRWQQLVGPYRFPVSMPIYIISVVGSTVMYMSVLQGVLHQFPGGSCVSGAMRGFFQTINWYHMPSMMVFPFPFCSATPVKSGCVSNVKLLSHSQVDIKALVCL